MPKSIDGIQATEDKGIPLVIFIDKVATFSDVAGADVDKAII